MPERIYRLNDDDNEPESLTEHLFDREDKLQELIAEHPELIDGEQMRPGDALRWILVKREMGIADVPEAANRWSIDHLLIDQEGMPTLVEVKRSSDTRARRAVVGQMLDYAAHASDTWSSGAIREAYERGERSRGRDPDQRLAELLELNEDLDVEQYWAQVTTNLEAQRLRLLFVADDIPDELARIVAFLNRHMADIEVLAVELKQFRGESSRMLVPRVIGRLDGHLRRRRSGRTKLTKDDFLAKFEDARVRLLTEKLLDVCSAHGGRFDGSRRLAIKVSCPLWRNQISVAWLTPPGPPEDDMLNSNHFLFGVFPAWEMGDLPEELRDRLDRWREMFNSRDGFLPVQNPWPGPSHDYGFVPCHAIPHGTTASQESFLIRSLGEVLDDLSNLHPVE